MIRKKTKDALELIYRDVGGDRTFRARVEEEKANAHIARMIYEARAKAGLTQKRLADLAGTTQPVIARLEDADYEGHSLMMLRRIAEALGQVFVVGFEAPRRPHGGRRGGAIRRIPVRAKKTARRGIEAKARARGA